MIPTVAFADYLLYWYRSQNNDAEGAFLFCFADAYRLMAQMIPTVAFADVAQTQDPIQKQWFRVTGGKDLDCCLDGCGCHTAQPYGACVRACVWVWVWMWVWVWVWVWVYKSIYI